MSRIVASIVAVIPVAVVAAVLAPPPHLPLARAAASAGSEEKAVRETLGHYLQGHATGDPDVMRQAFYPEGVIRWIRDGELQELTLEKYLDNFGGEPADDEAQRERRIASLDIQGTAASARIELDYPRAFIVDYMSLLKIEGEWKIVHKIFNVERKVER